MFGQSPSFSKLGSCREPQHDVESSRHSSCLTIERFDHHGDHNDQDVEAVLRAGVAHAVLDDDANDVAHSPRNSDYFNLSPSGDQIGHDESKNYDNDRDEYVGDVRVWGDLNSSDEPHANECRSSTRVGV